ncbi:hypothetical protein [Dyadobacter sp.]|uniref:hypothetical protein n=1 Tax=Dyadobacter sp. TaxID=1914288 RepID=UPI003263087F
MPKFTIQRSEKVGNTRIRLFKLITNQVCPIDEFEKVIEYEGAFAHEIDKIYAILECVCNLTMLPKTMYRVLQLGDLPFQVYEAKSSSLRFYLIKLEKTGKVIMMGGRKSTQNADLKQITRLAKEIYSHGIPETKI